MKKLATILAAVLIGLSAFAKDYSGNFYMVSTGEKLTCTKIQVGAKNIKATLENGEKVTVPISTVKMYSLNGKIYEKLPVFVDNKDSKQQMFMEFIATRAGLKLYKYTKYEEAADAVTGDYIGYTNVDHYVVFKGDQFHVELTERNYQTMFDFFRVKYRIGY